MFDFGQAVFNAVFRADPLEDVHKSVPIALPGCELYAVIGQDMGSL
jgi:hypothetical protein